jgi:hypothetical protein
MHAGATAMRHLLCIFVFQFALLGYAAEQPDRKELERLLGQQIDAKQVVDFVRIHELGKMSKGEDGSFSPPNGSYSVMFGPGIAGKGIVETIVINPSPRPNNGADWMPYTKPLPGGLASGDSRKVVERKLGAPIRPGGEWWIHGKLAIWVIFDPKESLESLYIYRKQDRP